MRIFIFIWYSNFFHLYRKCLHILRMCLYMKSTNACLFSVYYHRKLGVGVAQSVWLRTGLSGFDPRQRQRIFLLASASRPALGPTQPPVQWVPGVLSLGGKEQPGRNADHHLHLVPRLRMSRRYTSSPPKRLHGV
jgi:hypothetical protein